MPSTETIILENKQIRHKLRRIAYQIYEANSNETEVIIAGIQKNGFLLAKKLKTELEKISPISVVLCEIKIDKKSPINSIGTSIAANQYMYKSVVIVDDVLHSGTTLIYAVTHFLKVSLKQIKTVVLVDRNHKKYPIKADYKGISLSTSINENVAVIFEKNSMKAVLE